MEYSTNGDAERFPPSNDLARRKLDSKPSINGEQSIFESKIDYVGALRTQKTREVASHGLYKLSNLDQIVPYLIEVIIAFKKVKSGVDVGAILKESLGKVLEEYYPLAGRVKVGSDGRMVVECGGEESGVPFIEAFSGGEMAAVVGDITMVDQKIVRKLVYSDKRPYETILDVPPLAIQVTRFKCGGVTLGVRFNHVIMDGVGFSYFMRSWCEISRGYPLSIHPYMDRSILSPTNSSKIHFPRPEFSKIERPLTPQFIPKGIISTKSFLFTPTKLSQLKKLATHNNSNNNNNGSISRTPTTLELVSALSWICWTRAKKLGPEETTQIVTAVDGRGKINPPIPEGYFGNGIVWACAKSTAGEITRQPFYHAVGLVHDAIKAVTEDYVRSTIDFHEVTRMPLEVNNTMWMTKWSRLPVYEINFGWGGASQVAPGAVLENLVVLLLHEKDSKDVVITISLPLDAMEIFEDLVHSFGLNF